MEHISNLNAGAFNSMVKRLNLINNSHRYANRFVGKVSHDGFAVHLHNSMDVRLFKGVTVNSVPPFSLVVRHFVDGKKVDELNIDIWEYADIAPAIAETKKFIG